MPEDEKHTLLENIEIEAEEKTLNENWWSGVSLIAGVDNTMHYVVRETIIFL